jgi:hypothetical protein
MYILDGFHQIAEECCEIGRIQAESTKACSMTLQYLITENAKNLSTNCHFLSHICCLSNLRNYLCEEGLKTALRLLPCSQTKLDIEDSHQVLYC